jgi:hypothetical protein
MNHATTNAWILLALDMVGRAAPASLDKIIGAADTLNHAIPLHTELQTAIGWLMQQGLIIRHGRDYGLTQLGNDLLADVKSRTTNPFDGWDILKERFASVELPAELADISEAELQQAYDTYYKRATHINLKQGRAI